jgi:hypothetical protein
MSRNQINPAPRPWCFDSAPVLVGVAGTSETGSGVGVVATTLGVVTGMALSTIGESTGSALATVGVGETW